MKWLVAIAMVLCSSGCAGMASAWRAETCNYDGAYRLGMNDARSGEKMRGTIASMCDEPSLSAAQRGYREGYTAGASSYPITCDRDTCDQYTGRPEQHHVAAGRSDDRPRWRCERAYGKEDCGYRCASAYGNIACAKQPDHSCLAAYGHVRCGRDCRSRAGQIECD